MHCYLTVDLEDYKYNIMQRAGIARPLSDPRQPPRGVNKIISVLNKTPGSKEITFFTTGQVARENPELIKRLSNDGHEIACHTYSHKYIPNRPDMRRYIYEFENKDEFKNDLSRAIEVLRAHSNQDIFGFRAPNFSINKKNRRWVYEILTECGFVYDSSLSESNRRNSKKGILYEFPIYKCKLFGILPVNVIGGTWFRILPVRPKFLLPSIFSITGLMKKACDNGHTPIVYLHPSDIDDGLSAVSLSETKGLNRFSRIKLKILQMKEMWNRKNTAKKLEIVLKDFPNKGTLSESLPKERI